MFRKKKLRKKSYFKKEKRKSPLDKVTGRFSKNIQNRLKVSLSLTQEVYLSLFLFFAFKVESFKVDLIEVLLRIKKGLSQETIETKQMLEIYFRQSQGRATKREIKQANKQFQDVIKSFGLGIIIVLPFAPITLPLIVKLGQKLGVDILPDGFKDR